MAKLDAVVVLSEVAADGYVDVRPGDGAEWSIHNIFYGGAIHIEHYDVTLSLIFESLFERAHKEDDTTNVVTSADADDQDSVNTLLNEMKGDHNTHRVSTTFHNAADSTNVVDAANATNLATSLTLANQYKAKRNAHRQQEGVHPHFDAINEISSPDAIDLASVITLVNEEKADTNGHTTATAAGIYAFPEAVHVTYSNWIRVKNLAGVASLIAYDGIVTR